MTQLDDSKNTGKLETELDRILWYPGLDQKAMYDDMRAKVKALVEQQVLIGRITELKSFIQSMAHYPTDHAYEREPFYTVADSDYEDRIGELRTQLTTLKAQLKDIE